ncbi:MAG: DUF975 family protein [Clostridiales bacterium]|nr:DUF975 family protein [Clostridiales bacterium]
MNERIKLDARYLTSRRNFKIFSAVFWCAVIRLVLTAAAAAIVYLLFRVQTYAYIAQLSSLPVLPVAVYCAAALLAAGLLMLSARAAVSMRGALRLLAQGREPRFSEYFTCAGKRGLWSVLGMRVTVVFYKALWYFVLMLPAIIQAGLIYFGVSRRMIADNMFWLLITGLATTAFLGAFFGFCIVQRYSLSEELFCLSGLSAKEAVRRSIRQTQGECVRKAFFHLSFIPWFVLCISVIPCVYIVPYYKAACAVFRIRLSSCAANMVKLEEKPIIFGKPKPFTLDIKGDI